MTALVENPIPIVLVGIFVEAVLAVALVRTGRGALIWAMLGVLVLVGAGLALEWFVVTDYERIEDTLDGAAAAVEANDLSAVLSYCAEDATGIRREAERWLDYVTFTKVKITDLEVKINDKTSPPTALATLMVVVSGGERQGPTGHLTKPLRVNIQLVKQGERWLVTGYEFVGFNPM